MDETPYTLQISEEVPREDWCKEKFLLKNVTEEELKVSAGLCGELGDIKVFSMCSLSIQGVHVP